MIPLFYTPFAGMFVPKFLFLSKSQQVLSIMAAGFIFLNYASCELHKEQNQ